MKYLAAQLFAKLAVLAALVSCGIADPAPIPEANEPGASTVNGDTRITLERTECYGSCPAYSLSIVGDGTVDYFGESYVNVKGPATKQVSVSDIQALVDQMLQANYFNLSVPADCPTGVSTDAPGVTTSLTLDGRTHAIDHYHGNTCAPASLRSLEDAIDVAADSADWLECDGPCDR